MVKGYILSGILVNVSSFILCSISLPMGLEGGGVSRIKCGDRNSFHISLERLRPRLTVNDFRKVTLSLRAMFCFAPYCWYHLL